jgi:hypothetical protein
MHTDYIRETIASASDEGERDLFERQIALACRDLLLLVRERLENESDDKSGDAARFDVAPLRINTEELEEETDSEQPGDDVALPYVIVFDISRN